MEYRYLGSTGLRVSTQCLGAMMFGTMGNRDHDECVRMIHQSLDAGVNVIDTADVYSQGESEEIVGAALVGRREDVVLATKCFNPMGRERNRRGGSRRWIIQAVEDSLRRLGTDYIDLYQVHRHDWNTDLDETLGALSDLVHQGKVRYLGSSTFPADWIVEAQWVAERRGRERFVCEQPQYSIMARSIEKGELPACQRHGMGVIVWSPLAGGLLSGKYRSGAAVEEGSRYAEGGVFLRGRPPATEDPRMVERLETVGRLAALADEVGLPLTHMALAFSVEHPGVTATIIGPRTPPQLDDALAAADVRLADDVLDRIDGIVRPGTDVTGIDSLTGDPSLLVDRRRHALTRPKPAR